MKAYWLKINLNAKDNHGCTLIINTSKMGHKYVVKSFSKQNINLKSKDISG